MKLNKKEKFWIKLVLIVALICGSIVLTLEGMMINDYRNSYIGVSENICMILPRGCDLELGDSEVKLSCEGGVAILKRETSEPIRSDFDHVLDNEETGTKSYFKLTKDTLSQRFVGKGLNLSFEAKFDSKKRILPATITSCSDSFYDNFRHDWD